MCYAKVVQQSCTMFFIGCAISWQSVQNRGRYHCPQKSCQLIWIKFWMQTSNTSMLLDASSSISASVYYKSYPPIRPYKKQIPPLGHIKKLVGDPVVRIWGARSRSRAIAHLNAAQEELFLARLGPHTNKRGVRRAIFHSPTAPFAHLRRAIYRSPVIFKT